MTSTGRLAGFLDPVAVVTRRLAHVIDRLRADVDGDHNRSPLTSREDEVAALVGRGLTNRDVAATLVLSERTAENHVQHILTKLGFVNRSQIATWTARRGRDMSTRVE